MRKRARLLVTGLLVVVLLAGSWVLGRELWRQRRDDLGRRALDLLPNVAQRIRDFHRVKVEDGRKVWEVSAKEAQYYQEEQLVRVTSPVVSFFLEDGRVVALRGTEGRVVLGDRDLRRVELEGEIRVQLGDYSLETDYARYEREPNLITAPGVVRVHGAEFDLSGEGMEVRVDDQRLTLFDEVETTLWPTS
jgi:LPS export ABC transporter protein LptC